MVNLVLRPFTSFDRKVPWFQLLCKAITVWWIDYYIIACVRTLVTGCMRYLLGCPLPVPATATRLGAQNTWSDNGRIIDRPLSCDASKPALRLDTQLNSLEHHPHNMTEDRWARIFEKLCGRKNPHQSQDSESGPKNVIVSSNSYVKPPLHALIMGINNYAHHNKLQAAVNDAEAFKSYLTTTLLVPENQIDFLRDEQANREGIIGAFQRLIHNDAIQRDDPIVIYYAGHGGETVPPPDHSHNGPLIQCLIPQDCGTKSMSGASPIPDFTIGALLDQLSDAKGNNITVIFDCCHSAGGSRDDTDSARFVDQDKLPPLPPNTDSDIRQAASSGSRGLVIPEELSGRAMNSHVLLAACAHGECAYEDRDAGRGYFTTALLDLLNKSGIDNLTYKGCMQRFPLIRPKGGSQNPVCEGNNVDRIFFNAKVPGADSSFILITTEGSQYYLQAGLAQGVTPGCSFAIHSSTVLGPNNPSLGTLVVDRSEPFRAVLRLPKGDPPFTIPEQAYGRQIGCGPDRALDVFITDEFADATRPDPIWEQAFSGGESNLVLRPANEVVAQVIVGLDVDKRATFTISNPAANKYGVEKSPRTVPVEAELVLRVLRAAARWNWHLQRTPGSHPFQRAVELEFYKLKEQGWGADGSRILGPDGDSLNAGGEADIVVSPKDFYGLKIINNTTRDLYAYPFYFSLTDQAIYPQFTKVVGTGKIDPSLPSKFSTPNGNFVTVGYGSGGVLPFHYFLSKEQDIDVGIYKVFLTTSPTDFDSVKLDSPFDDKRAIASDDEVEEAIGSQELWDTITMTLVQRRHSKQQDNGSSANKPKAKKTALLSVESPNPTKARSFGPNVNSSPWFRTSAISQDLLSKASQLQLRTFSKQQGPSSSVVPKEDCTWFDICLIAEDGAPKLRPDDEEEILQWRSHANKNGEASASWIDGLVFEREHEIWSFVEACDSFEVIVNAKNRGWVNEAEKGVLEVW